MEQMHHHQTLEFISKVELPSKFNKLLNITVDGEPERRENDKVRIDRYHQIHRFCNLTGPELELKVPDAGYASLYRYNSLSAQNRTWNLIHPSNKVCKAILVSFRSIREGYLAQNMAGHTKQTNLKCQERLNIALANIGRPMTEGKIIIDDDDCPPELVHDDSSVENDTGYSSNGSASTGCPDENDIQTAENVNDETEHGYSSIDEEHRRIAGSNKKAKS